VGILLVVFLAIYRRGQTSAREFVALEEEELTNQMMSEQLEDIPDIVTEDEDFDDEDDLELLDDLKDI
jgi:hypothetical protein